MLRALAKPALAALVALAMVPALGELFEATIHLARTGSVAHEVGTHEGPGAPGVAEHGCSGTFHFCHCCPQPTLIPAVVESGAPRLATTVPRPLLAALPDTEAHALGTFRPPRSS